MKHYADSCVFIDVISSDRLEIYVGSEYFSESWSDGEISYHNYSVVSLEKASKLEWKPRFLNLELEFNKLFKIRMCKYLITRDHVVNNYQKIYSERSQIETDFSLNDPEIVETGIFKTLFYLLDKSHYITRDQLYYTNYEERYFRQLLRQNKKQLETKDWKDDYLDLEFIYNYLSDIDLNDFQLMKTHVISIYTERFNLTVDNFKYNYTHVDEQKYRTFFNSLMDQLDL
ncbi:hypothetical protein [Mucilaginibacter myungsuensis]|uniref:Uncharacterized protein n=1 Tax=Mucilaginibacter myungsuensis TaxID=649104 RepID=A0A929L1F2_9SPHI|nr:hypothetical protein [Mucilaginibacter myungsuensis]MBE9662340.1 hypothetical protein [Mucilaginibacter myungsuensis]MDN3599223.1 hypothetical protein [Mucilaginibacter myungsuensis]